MIRSDRPSYLTPEYLNVVSYVDPVVAICRDCGLSFYGRTLDEVCDRAASHRDGCDRDGLTRTLDAALARHEQTVRHVYLLAANAALACALLSWFGMF